MSTQLLQRHAANPSLSPQAGFSSQRCCYSATEGPLRRHVTSTPRLENSVFSKEGAQKSARNLSFHWPFAAARPGGSGAPQRRARKSPRAASSFHWPQKSARISGHQPRGNGAPQRRARKSPRAIFPSTGPFWPPVPGERRSSKEGAQKSARNLFHWPFAAASPGGSGAPQRRARKSPRAAFLSIGPFWPPVPGERRSSKGGAQKSARDLSFHWPFLAASSGGSGAPQRRARKSPRAPSFLSTGPFWPPVPGERRSSKEGAQKSARSLFLPLALSGHQSRGNGAPQRRARKSPRAASSFHWPFLATSPGGTALLKGGRAKVRARLFPLALLATSPGGTALLKGGRAKVRAQPLLSIGPFWPPAPGETSPQRRAASPHWPFAGHQRRSAQKSARSLFFPLALPGHQSRGNGAPQRRARKSPRATFPSIGPSWPPVPGNGAPQRRARKSPRASLFLPLALSGRQSRGERRSSKEGAQKSARSLFLPLGPSWPPVPGERRSSRRARKSPRAAFLSIGPFWPPVPGERRSSKEGAQKSARDLSFHWPFLAASPGGSGAPQRRARKSPRAPLLSLAFLATSPGGTALLKGGRAKVARSLSFHWPFLAASPGGSGAPQRRARKSPRAASSFHWPFLAPSPGGTALLKGGRAKVRARPFLSLALPRRQSRGNGAPQRRARKSPRAASSFHWPFVAASPGGSGAPQRRARKSPRAASSFHWPFLATSPGGTALLKGGRAKVRAQPLPSIGPSWPPVPGERRSSKEGAQKSARSLFLPLALPGRQSRGKRRSSKEGAQKSARSLFFPLALPGRQSRGNGAPQRRARKSPRAASSIHWPFLATSPWGTALLKGGRAKVRAQPLPFHWPFLAASPGETALLKGGRAKVRAQPLLSIGPSWPPVPREAALLKGGRAKVRAQPLPSMGPSWPPVPGERRSSKEGAQKSARSLFFPLALSGHQSPGERRSSKGGAQKSARDLSFHWPFLAASSGGSGAPQRRARKSPRAASSFHGPFLAASPGGTALLKGGRAKVRAQPLLSIGPFWPPVPGGTALLKGGRAKVRAQPRPSIGPFWPPVPGERRSSKEGAQKSARSLFLPLALPGRQSRGNGAPQRRARKSPRAASSFHWPFLATSPGGTALLKGGRAKVRAQPFLPLALPGHQSRGNGAPQRRARKSPRAASSFHWPFLATSPRGTALLKGGRAKVRAQTFP